MTQRIDPSALTTTRAAPEQRARAIYENARGQAADRLWRAALGGADATVSSAVADGPPQSRGLAAYLANYDPDAVRDALTMGAPAMADPASDAGAAAPASDAAAADAGALATLGVNERHRAALEKAAARSGIPAAALASIIDAEAAKGPGGRWNVYSRNPRSSAAGLGQFLSGTWVGLAEQRGSWLNAAARRNGWIGASGRVRPESRSAVLALRYNADASIQAIADYSRGNIDRLRRSGIAVGNSVEDLTRTAYLAHYMGPGDAARFLRGRLDSNRALALLNAQVGSARAGRRVAAAGGAIEAHRLWLSRHVARNVRPLRYMAAAASSDSGAS